MESKTEIKVRDLVNAPIIIIDQEVHSLVEELEYYGNDICSRCSLHDECKLRAEISNLSVWCDEYSANQNARYEKGRININAPISSLLWLQDCAYEGMKEIQMVFPYNINKTQK